MNHLEKVFFCLSSIVLTTNVYANTTTNKKDGTITKKQYLAKNFNPKSLNYTYHLTASDPIPSDSTNSDSSEEKPTSDKEPGSNSLVTLDDDLNDSTDPKEETKSTEDEQKSNSFISVSENISTADNSPSNMATIENIFIADNTSGSMDMDDIFIADNTSGSIDMDDILIAENTCGACDIDDSFVAENTSDSMNMDDSFVAENTSGSIDIDDSFVAENTSSSIDIDDSFVAENTSGSIDIDDSFVAENTSGSIDMDDIFIAENTSGSIDMDDIFIAENTCGACDIDDSFVAENTSGSIDMDDIFIAENTSGSIDMDDIFIAENTCGACDIDDSFIADNTSGSIDMDDSSIDMSHSETKICTHLPGSEFIASIIQCYEEGTFAMFFEDLENKYMNNATLQTLDIPEKEHSFWNCIERQKESTIHTFQEDINAFILNNPESNLAKSLNEFLHFSLTEEEKHDICFFTNSVSTTCNCPKEETLHSLWQQLKPIVNKYKVLHDFVNSEENSNEERGLCPMTKHLLLDIHMKTELLNQLDGNCELAERILRSFEVYKKYTAYQYNNEYITNLFHHKSDHFSPDEFHVKSLMNNMKENFKNIHEEEVNWIYNSLQQFYQNI